MSAGEAYDAVGAADNRSPPRQSSTTPRNNDPNVPHSPGASTNNWNASVTRSQGDTWRHGFAVMTAYRRAKPAAARGGLGHADAMGQQPGPTQHDSEPIP